MKPFVVFVCVMSFGSAIVFGDVKVAERRQDSYINALQDTHGKSNEFIPGAQPDNFGATYPSAGYDYKPYAPPAPAYGVPHQTYGVPHQTYGNPQYSHPPPHAPYPVYGPPANQAARGDWLWDKFHLKFDLLTMGKILIKLLLFKKIVKFFGVICLLMFLPTLIEKKKAQNEESDGYGEEMFRNLKPIDESARFNELTSFVLTSIESFADKQQQSTEADCGVSCRFSRMLDTVDKSYPWKRVAKWVRSNGVSVAQKVLPSSENQLDSLDEALTSNSSSSDDTTTTVQ